MTILLAPMEGLLDFVLRDILTRVGGVDRCVSEFIRVTNTLLPDRVFIRVMPELLNGGRTFAGVPVRGQLLGSDPVCLAENAACLAALGPDGIDLNFGCPAKVVNRHGGGAALLDEPELLHAIVAAVRRAVPAHMPVSAKMRLGFNDDSRAVECALAIEGGGANELVVHARTKADAYRPPAYWERIADIRAGVHIPVVANGEIWNVQDAMRCRQESGCDMLMLGRGMVTDPGLALAIQAATAMREKRHPLHASPSSHSRSISGGSTITAVEWQTLLPLIGDFWRLVCARLERRQQAGRLKQWLNFLRRRHPEAEVAYMALRTINEPAAIDQWLACVGVPGCNSQN
ncbi:tRNA-dihydrouridine synthase [Rhodoferax sp.]|uniref:tRNA dihydrouridine synthase n=1 Tax=Rhodoferax sp. TaxID=50421 RepID=UPI002718E20B|nr:tRNA-dihydrouridine synthase [Rhodoferax sp.]MDO9197923.1 tRNA-dihydrouridine synthase [Rhodoferax sp.]